MISAGELTCPAGMVLQKPEGAVHPDEPAFCVEKTEAPQKSFMDFLKLRYESAYEEVSELLAGNKVKGGKKPAVFARWGEAQSYCMSKYRGGDLPTERQWENACGGGRYCTASGELNHQEAIYGADGPADVDGPGADKRVNRRGVQDMTGNVWEWMRDDAGDGYKCFRGGSWYSSYDWILRAGYRDDLHPGGRSDDVGFRCVAPPQDSKE